MLVTDNVNRVCRLDAESNHRHRFVLLAIENRVIRCTFLIITAAAMKRSSLGQN
jgi:hypothetical protein